MEEHQRWQLRCMLWARQKPLQLVSWLTEQAGVQLSESVQQDILSLLHEDELLVVVPLEPAYHTSLLKQLIAAAERTRQDLCDELVIQYAEALQDAKSDHPLGETSRQGSWSIKTFFYCTSVAPPICPAASSLSQSGCAVPNPSCCSPAGPSRSQSSSVNQALLQHHAVQVEAALQQHAMHQSATGWTNSIHDTVPCTEGCTGSNEGVDNAAATAGDEVHSAQTGSEHPSTKGLVALAHMDTGDTQSDDRLSASAHMDCGDMQAGDRLSAPAQGSLQHIQTATGKPEGSNSTPLGPQHTEQQSKTQCGLVSLRVSSNMLAGGTGCAEWEAGFVLAEAILTNPHLVAGRCGLEVGCGAGVAGIAAARAGARQLLLTDGDHNSAANCLFNCRLNGVQAEPLAAGCVQPLDTSTQVVQCSVLEWGTALDHLPASFQPDVILGSDLLYDPVVIPDLVHLFKALLIQGQQAGSFQARQEPLPLGQEHSADISSCGVQDQAHCNTGNDREVLGRQHLSGCTVYLATTRRNEATLALFVEQVKQAGLMLEDVTDAVNSPEGVKCSSSRDHGGGGVCFQHLPWLDAARARVLIHRITAGKPCKGPVV